MVVWGKSIPEAQLHGYNHQTDQRQVALTSDPVGAGVN